MEVPESWEGSRPYEAILSFLLSPLLVAITLESASIARPLWRSEEEYIPPIDPGDRSEWPAHVHHRHKSSTSGDGMSAVIGLGRLLDPRVV